MIINERTAFAGNVGVFIDTCSLMHPMYPRYEEKLFAELRMMGKKLLVISRVLGELRRLARPGRPKAENAKYALRSIEHYRREDLVEVVSCGRDSHHADNAIACAFIREREKRPVALITQDVALAHDILGLNSLASQAKGKQASVYRITSVGTLGVNNGDLEAQAAARAAAARAAARAAAAEAGTAAPATASGAADNGSAGSGRRAATGLLALLAGCARRLF